MIQAYADGELFYDSRLEEYALLGLTATVGLNKGGTASIVLPPHHPAYNRFVGYRTLVEIYRDDVLVFRGRALYPTDDFYNRRTITCEGERCFLRDGVLRPYLYQDDPANILQGIIAEYNAQVDEFKRFAVGTVTVTDPNNYIRLESEAAELCSDVLDKLVERCGGYIMFTTNAAGQRVIHWLEELSYQSGQAIEFGENLLDFSRSSLNEELATVVIPYGAKDENTGARITVESVNNGLDYIQDDEAVALRGVIAVPVTWDDVTEPSNLLAKAQQYLDNSKLMLTSLDLSAVDLSDLDKNIDTFQVGDFIQVRSKPHGIDEAFQLTERTYDLLDPAQGKIHLGKEVATLSGADAAADKRSTTELQKLGENVSTSGTVVQKLEKEVSASSSVVQKLEQEVSGLVAAETAEGSGVLRVGTVLVQWGRVTITPTAADTPTAATVTFGQPFGATPVITTTPVSDTPQALRIAVQPGNASAVVTLSSSDASAAIDIAWQAVGPVND